MELLSNVTWMIVALALWSVWLVRRRSARDASLCPGITAQLTALAVLTLILLPAISVSDDLQAAQNPAEVERTCIRSDRHLVHPDAVPSAPAVFTGAIGSLLVPSPRTIAFLHPHSVPPSAPVSHIRVSASRPPPAV